MAGYIGSNIVVTQIDGFNKTETNELFYDKTESDDLFVDKESSNGIFDKRSDPDDIKVAWKKEDVFEVKTNVEMVVGVGNKIYTIPEDTAVDPESSATPVVGADYAIWITPSGDLVISDNFSVAPVANSRKLGGFHYAPGGNATLSVTGDWTTHNGGDTTEQINEYSFYDLKWKPSVIDPRGLTLVNNSFWTGMYLMSDGASAPLHKYNVSPCRDGNAPFKPYATTPTRYSNAAPMNIFETLKYNGFSAPNHNEFQLLALGVNEQRSIGGSDPGNTGIVTDRNKNQQTSAWGVFDATGVLIVWGRDSLPDDTQDNNVTQGRSNNVFRISRFGALGGGWNGISFSGSRYVGSTPSSLSVSNVGGRGCCSHCIIP